MDCDYSINEGNDAPLVNMEPPGVALVVPQQDETRRRVYIRNVLNVACVTLVLAVGLFLMANFFLCVISIKEFATWKVT